MNESKRFISRPGALIMVAHFCVFGGGATAPSVVKIISEITQRISMKFETYNYLLARAHNEQYPLRRNGLNHAPHCLGFLSE